MAEIWSPRGVWTRQPPAGARVNWANPLTRNLLALVDPRSNAELVRGTGLVGTRKTQPALGAVATDKNGTGYLGITPPTSASSPSAYLDIASGDITVFAVCAQIGAATNANQLFGRFKGSSAANYSVGLHTGTFNGPLARLGSYSYSPGTASKQRLYEILPVAIVGQSGTAYTYFRGEFVNSGAYTQTAYEYDGSGARAVSIGSNGYGLAMVGVCYLGAIWNRALSATEIATLSANPWQLFAPQRQVTYFSATTGVTATLATAQAADVAALSATVTNRASIAPTQAADTAALAATVTNRASIAATQAADIAALSALIQTNPAASIAATQAADTAVLGATVTNRAQLAPQQAADTAAINVIAGSLDVAIAATQAPDSAAIVVQLPSRTGAGASRRGKRRRIVLGDQVYDVLERDLPTLLEAVMLNRKPPATAVVEPAQPAARAQEKSEPTQVEARAPLPSLKEARERYEAMLADINRAATADVAALLQRVADRVLAELEDDEDAAVTLLLH